MPVVNPSQVPVTGPGTPYITPTILTNAPTGISWSTIPDRNAVPAAQTAAQLDICARASSMIDGACNQPLRCTVDVETWTGPGDFRCQLQPTGVTRLLSSRRPVTAVIGGRVSSSASFPRSWQTVPANQFEPEIALIGVYGTTAPGASGAGGQAILMAPGWVTWCFGRMSSRIEVTYLNGWPHCSIQAPVTAGATSVTVDNITGWLGAAGNVYDGGQQEFVTVTAVTPAVTGAITGPGTLGLSAPLTYGHPAGALLSTLPQSVHQAALYYCIAQALTRGATATAVQAVSGGATGGGPSSSEDYYKLADSLVQPYKLVI